MRRKKDKGGNGTIVSELMKNENVKIIPLGGLKEIGKNMTVLEYGNDIFIVDVGVAFPDDSMLGVEAVIPDFTYIRENQERVKAVIITHAHEDHIGALQYFIKEFNYPIYATKLTAAIIKSKVRGLKKEINIINTETKLDFGQVKFEFFGTNHSIPDSVAVVMKTPVGNIVHTGDFKFDYTPIDGKQVDFAKMAKIGQEGVLMLLSDSTNAEKEGVSISEYDVQKALEREIALCKGKVVVATFASSLHRVPALFEAAKVNNRKVHIFGKRMESNVKIMQQLNLMNIPDGLLVGEKELEKIDDNELLVIVTGAQGEELAGLTRMANGENKKLKLEEGDNVIFSSSTIPGNEKSVGKIVNKLIEKNVRVISKKEIHTSGHGNKEEQKLMLSVLKPKFFMPVHGEYRMLEAHKQTAINMGINPNNIIIAKNGSVIEVNQEKAQIKNEVSGEDVMVDVSGMGYVGVGVMRDRVRLANHGMAIVQVNIFDKEKKIIKVNISLKAVVAEYSRQIIAKEIKEIIKVKIDEMKNITELKRNLYDEVGNVIYAHIKRKPMIEILINEIRPN